MSLLEAVDYLALLAQLRPEKFPRAAVRWHGRLEIEAATLTLAESQFALGALALLGEGHIVAADVLRALIRRAKPTLVPRVS